MWGILEALSHFLRQKGSNSLSFKAVYLQSGGGRLMRSSRRSALS